MECLEAIWLTFVNEGHLEQFTAPHPENICTASMLAQGLQTREPRGSVSANFPCSHMAHLPSPAEDENPSEQGTHAVPFDKEIVPSNAHGSQETAPNPEILPGSQLLHSFAPVSAANMPAVHALHWVAPCAPATVPAAHSTQEP